MNKSKHLSVRVTPEQKETLLQMAAEQELTLGQLLRRAVLGLAQVRQPKVASPPKTTGGHQPLEREREIRWLEEHRAELEHLAGQWVMLDGSRLVSHHPDYLVALEKARAAGVSIPFVEWIPEPTNGIWPGSQSNRPKARTGKVPKSLTLGGTAKKRKPSSGKAESPVICSTMGML